MTTSTTAPADSDITGDGAPNGAALAVPSILKARLKKVFSSPPVLLAVVIGCILILVTLFAPWVATADPVQMDPSARLKGSSADYWLGTDAFGRDLFSRIVYGGRISLTIGLGVALASVAIGLLLGVIAGYFRWIGGLIMRVMDGLMAIPNILLAIALVALSGASLTTVLLAITLPEIPRVVRLVRSVILSVRQEPYVEAALSMGTSVPKIMIRHMMPSCVAPLIVQGTYIFASAMITESILSFLGAGIPPEIPSWGNIMAESRSYFQLKPWLILYPGIMLSLAVLSINILGDAFRDAFDPKLTGRN